MLPRMLRPSGRPGLARPVPRRRLRQQRAGAKPADAKTAAPAKAEPAKPDAKPAPWPPPDSPVIDHEVETLEGTKQKLSDLPRQGPAGRQRRLRVRLHPAVRPAAGAVRPLQGPRPGRPRLPLERLRRPGARRRRGHQRVRDQQVRRRLPDDGQGPRQGPGDRPALQDADRPRPPRACAATSSGTSPSSSSTPDGKVVARFNSKVEPMAPEVIAAVEKALPPKAGA
jgi:hypothetical protein